MAYPANVNKAQRIFNGENPFDVLGGMKVRSFFHNLLLDDSFVTVDRHAISIALYGLDKTRSGSTVATDKAYVAISNAYRNVAEKHGLPAYVVQSVTWTFKAANNGKVI